MKTVSLILACMALLASALLMLSCSDNRYEVTQDMQVRTIRLEEIKIERLGASFRLRTSWEMQRLVCQLELRPVPEDFLKAGASMTVHFADRTGSMLGSIELTSSSFTRRVNDSGEVALYASFSIPCLEDEYRALGSWSLSLRGF